MSGEWEVQRYRHYYNTWCGSESEAFSVEDPDGDWVKRDDHVRVVEGLRAERDGLSIRLQVLDGTWCAENRSQGRGGCGLCGWCCKQARDERDAALLRVGEAEKLLREAMEDMKPSVRFRKDEHGEMRAVPGYVCLLKRIEGFLGGVGEGS